MIKMRHLPLGKQLRKLNQLGCNLGFLGQYFVHKHILFGVPAFYIGTCA